MEAPLTGIAYRQLMTVVGRRMTEEPAIVLNGPRTVGKSTLLHELSGRAGRPVIDCDDPATRAAVRSDPYEDGTLVLPLDVLWKNGG